MSTQQHRGHPEPPQLSITQSSPLCSARSASQALGTQGRANKAPWSSPCPSGHDGIARDRAVQRDKVFTQHLSREAFAQWRNKNMQRLWNGKLRGLTGPESWRTGRNWARGAKQSKCRKLSIMYKHAKNMVQWANFVSSEVSFTAKFYCLKDHRTFRRKEKPGLRLSKDVLPVSAMKAIIWISY